MHSCPAQLLLCFWCLSQFTFDLSPLNERMKAMPCLLTGPINQVVFYYMPEYAGRKNQVEIWLSILVHNPLNSGNFSSLDDLLN